MVLEGDEGYRCWEALSEFENIKVVPPLAFLFPAGSNFFIIKRFWL
jgi:hypothetical protein